MLIETVLKIKPAERKSQAKLQRKLNTDRNLLLGAPACAWRCAGEGSRVAR